MHAYIHIMHTYIDTKIRSTSYPQHSQPAAFLLLSLAIYIHAYTPYIHTDHTYVHACIHTYIHITCIREYIQMKHTYTPYTPYIHTY